MRSRTSRILLIEDDPGDAKLVQLAIAQSDTPMHLQRVSRICEAVEALAHSRFDLVLSDLSLPDSEGRDTISKLHRQSPDVPIVILTSRDDNEFAMTLLDAGVQDYLVKDQLTPDVLDHAIRHAIQRQQNYAEIKRLLKEVQEGRELVESKNRKLEKLYKQAHEFVDNVSHEFRTPLTVIKEYVSLIRDGLAGEVTDEQRRMLNVVEDRSDDLNTMVDDMLDVSRLEAGLLGAWRRSCQVPEIIDHIMVPLARKASIKGVRLECRISDDLPRIYCDPEKVGRVITNLGVNAIKFCGDPGAVQISARADRPSQNVVFSIADNGPGMDQQGMVRIFERFQQLGGNSRGSCNGFGLGLSIAKELVDLNFGEIDVNSQVGAGTTFCFSVPLDNPHEVMQRYLDRIKALPNGLTVVSLFEARVDESVEQSLADDVDCFLNFLLRKNDLLFRGEQRRWLLALPIPGQAHRSYFDRAHKAWEDANRNRPYGPLPRLHMEALGSWRAAVQRDEVLECVRQLLPVTEVVYV